MSEPVHMLNKYEGPFLKSFIALPAPELRDYIESFCGEEFYATNYPGKYMPPVLVLPNGRVEMFIGYHDTSYVIRCKDKTLKFSTLIHGVRDIQNPLCLYEPKINKQIHVFFKPAGFHRFFGIRDAEMRNSCFTIDEVLYSQVKELEARMNDFLSVEDRVQILDRFFLKRLYANRGRMSNDDVVNAVKLIIAARGKKRIHEVSKELMISTRTLQRQFVNRIGLSPKEFSNVVRFRNALDKIISANSIDWQDLVRSCGYYDQSHLIDEFKAATTFSPESFFSQKGRSVIPYRRAALILTGPLSTQYDSSQRAMQESEESASQNRTKKPRHGTAESHNEL